VNFSFKYYQRHFVQVQVRERERLKKTTEIQ
jgi:hypothetical protein